MIFLNGKYIQEQDAKVEYNDRGLLLSDGIFETLRAYDGEISCLSDHYERLKKSANFLDIPFSITMGEMNEATKKLLELNELKGKNASLRMTLTRGTGPRGLLPPESVNPTLMLTAFPYAPSIAKPLKVVISDVKRNEFSPLSNIKSLCYLDNIIARRNAAKKGADECIMLNTQGSVACASVANIFIVTSKGVITPRLEDGVLPGITRKMVIQICKTNNIPIFEEKISEIDLINAKEIFITNRLIEIQPIMQINNELINEGKIGTITSQLQNIYKKNLINTFTCKKNNEKNEKHNLVRSNL